MEIQLQIFLLSDCRYFKTISKSLDRMHISKRRHDFTNTIHAEEQYLPSDGLTARRSNQSILKEISPECSLEGLMLKLKLQ